MCVASHKTEAKSLQFGNVFNRHCGSSHNDDTEKRGQLDVNRKGKIVRPDIAATFAV